MGSPGPHVFFVGWFGGPGAPGGIINRRWMKTYPGDLMLMRFDDEV